jgi:hypothetical protein
LPTERAASVLKSQPLPTASKICVLLPQVQLSAQRNVPKSMSKNSAPENPATKLGGRAHAKSDVQPAVVGSPEISGARE